MTASAAASPADDTDDAILLALLAARERGEALDAAALAALFPGHGADVERLLRAVSRYDVLARAVRPPAPDAPLAPGTRLGDFEIGAFLARGGMGSVYRATQASLAGRAVALKVLDHGRTSPAVAARFRREALTLAGLHHRHLAEVFGFGEQGGHLYFAMRLVEGPTLRDVLERLASRRARGRTLRDDERRRLVTWAAEAAEALGLVHASGLVHRDLKPANLMIDGRDPGGDELPEGPAVLVDFGLVRPVEGPARTLTGLGVGSLPYAPGEQLMGLDVDARADVFGLGVTLHDLLAGRTPEQRGAATAGLEPLARRDPDCDADLAAVVGKAADPLAAWRYADGAALAADLRAWLTGDAVRARRPPLHERLRRSLARHPKRWLRAGAAAAVVLVAGALVAVGLLAAGHASAARDALASADIARLADSLERLGALGRRLFLRASPWPELAARLGAAADADPLRQVADLQRRGAVDEALLVAATRLRVSGLVAEPLLVELLARSLDSPQPGTRETAAALCARLLHERPDVSPDDPPASAPLRERVLRIARDPGRPVGERLLALTALSGCATPGEIVPLLELALAARDTHHETLRLGLMAVERTVRRSHGLERLHELPDDAAWTPALRFLREATRTHAGKPGHLSFDLTEMSTRSWAALCFARRAIGGEPPLLSVSPEFAAPPESRSGVNRSGMRARAQAGDQTIAPILLDELTWALADLPRAIGSTMLPMFGTDVSPHDLGRLAGELDDPELESGLRERLRDAGVELADFERGFALAGLERRGIVEELHPDADTWLGAAPEGRITGPLPVARAGHLDAESDHWPWGLAATSLGGWIFPEDGARAWGVAGALSADDASWIVHGGGRLPRLTASGTSAITLHFELPADAAPAPLELRLCAIAASRTYLPDRGMARLRISFNGQSVGDPVLHAHSAGEGVDDIPLQAHLFVPGPQRIRIEIDPLSVSPAWIFGAALVPRTLVAPGQR